MRTSQLLKVAALTVFFLSSSVLFPGCGWEEDQDSGEDLGIQPTSVTLNADQVIDVVFTCSGGSGDYTWAVSDNSLGTLAAGDSTAIYTNNTVTGENIIAVTDGLTTVSANVIQE